MVEQQLQERVIRVIKVYGKQRVQIPAYMTHYWDLQDGDEVTWFEHGVGTFLLRPFKRQSYRRWDR